MGYKKMPLKVLVKTGWLSEKLIDDCERNNFRALSDIIRFYKSNGSFENLNFGDENFKKELLVICERFIVQPEDKIRDGEELRRMLSEFNEDEMDQINPISEHFFLQLNSEDRAKVSRIFQEIPGTKKIVEIIYSPAFSFTYIKGIGSKIALELESIKKEFFDSIKRFYLSRKHMASK